MFKLLSIFCITLGFSLRLSGQTPSSTAYASPALKNIEATFQSEISLKVDAPFQTGLKNLRDAYKASIETSLKRTSSAGELDAALAVKEEMTRFATEGTVPEVDATKPNGEVSRLRTAYRVEMFRLNELRHSAMKPIVDAHVARLHTLAIELTKAMKLEEAKAVEGRATEILSMDQVKPTTPKPAFTKSIVSPSPSITPLSGKADTNDFGALLKNATWEWHESSATKKPVGEVRFVDDGKLETKIHYIESWKRISANRISVTKIDGLYWIFEFHRSKKIATSVPLKGSIGSTTEIRVKD